MSVRSSISARLMETWAHGQEVYDVLGVLRVNSDRIRNIAHLGINNLPDSYYDDYRAAVREVDQAQVLEQASKYYDGQKAIAVVAGDAARLGKPLSHFASVVVLDPDAGFTVKQELPHDPAAKIELERESGT